MTDRSFRSTSPELALVDRENDAFRLLCDIDGDLLVGDPDDRPRTVRIGRSRWDGWTIRDHLGQRVAAILRSGGYSARSAVVYIPRARLMVLGREEDVPATHPADRRECALKTLRRTLSMLDTGHVDRVVSAASALGTATFGDEARARLLHAIHRTEATQPDPRPTIRHEERTHS